MYEQIPIALESEAGFRVLFKCATISILVINVKGNIELSNPCAEKLFGYEPAELIGSPLEVLIPESLRSQHTHHREKYFERPKSRPMGLGMELYAKKKNGEIFPVEISLGHYEFDGERLAVAFVTDITAQVNAKKLMAEREAWFRNMADNSPVMIWVCGADKQFNYFNHTWLQYTGHAIDQETGFGWYDHVHADDRVIFSLTFSNAFDLRQPFQMECRIKRRDGRYRWINYAGKPTFYDDVFTGFIGTAIDIHDQRMMKEELEHLVRRRTTELYEALDREREMSELKSRFVSMASHEFRTPLSIVLSSTTLIEQYGIAGKDERIAKHLLRIKSSINNLTNILNDFLSLDKLEQGKVDLEYEIFDMTAFMNEVVEDVSTLRKSDQIINIRHEGENAVLLDQKKLRYILVNLLSNSVKYSPPDTEIIISSENGPERVRIVVQDHGIGIPEEEQKYLYNKFFRAKNTGNVQGTGLGLTIVKRYVELMGGVIEFFSKPGEGTTFTLQVPKS
ncbi:MAG: PAS domain-containing sensor histidine kinase [Chryseosolibacter sp.]